MSANDHGSDSTYNNYGCRCEECRAAHVAKQSRRNGIRAGRLASGDATPEHGKIATYTNWRCRCQSCLSAHAAYRRRLRYSKKVAA